MCIICEGRISEVKEELDCFGCPLLTVIPNIPGLKKLNCSDCTSLILIPVIPGLKYLDCGRCSRLIEIPVIPELEHLLCDGCSRLTEIPVIPGLKYLDCSNCRLREIPTQYGFPTRNGFPKLKYLYCSGCTILTKIPDITGFELFYCVDCPWLVQNPYNKISQGLKLQRWIKKNFKYFAFCNWIKSNEAKEFLYHPDNIGGRIEKSKMKKVFEGLTY